MTNLRNIQKIKIKQKVNVDIYCSIPYVLVADDCAI